MLDLLELGLQVAEATILVRGTKPKSPAGSASDLNCEAISLASEYFIKD